MNTCKSESAAGWFDIATTDEILRRALCHIVEKMAEGMSVKTDVETRGVSVIRFEVEIRGVSAIGGSSG